LKGVRDGAPQVQTQNLRTNRQFQTVQSPGHPPEAFFA
jgi:hypothetical protein